MQNAVSALQAVPEAAFTQEASLRQQPPDRGRPPADGEEVAHRQVALTLGVKYNAVHTVPILMNQIQRFTSRATCPHDKRSRNPKDHCVPSFSATLTTDVQTRVSGKCQRN